MEKILAIIVLYNPDELISQRIGTIKKQVSTLVVYDNSTDEKVITKNKAISNLDDIIYVGDGRNNGIASALSFGAKYGLEKQYDYYVTFDQDSLIPDNYIMSMISSIRSDSKIGVIGPIYNDSNTDRKSRFPVKKGILTIRSCLSNKTDITDVLMIISSGSVYPISVFSEAGYFLDELFIDYVDNEFCLRLLMRGYRVCINPKIIISHALGNRTKKGVFIHCSPTNYPFYRKYYMTRNRLFVYKKYFMQFPSLIFYDVTAFIWDFIRVILFEKDKWNKVRAYGRGIKDFMLGHYGPMK